MFHHISPVKKERKAILDEKNDAITTLQVYNTDMDAKKHLLTRLYFGRAHLNQIISGTRNAQYLDGLVLAEETGTEVSLWCDPAEAAKRTEAIKKFADEKKLKIKFRRKKNDGPRN